jgi:hypothetical protein
MTSSLCELCNKNERYHICPESNNQHLCLTCFNKLHFGIGAPRIGKSYQWYNNAFFAMQYMLPMLKAMYLMYVMRCM